MTIKVARVTDLNCEPYYYDMERRGIELRDMPPRDVAKAALEGDVDSGPVPIVDCQLLGDQFRPISGFCVAAVTNSSNTILYSQVPVEDLGGIRIGINGEDPTPLRLLQVLLSLKHQVGPPEFGEADDTCAALLLTGNQALRRRRGLRGYPHRYDLGEEWHEWTGLPFVFTRWMVRNDMERQDSVVLEDSLFVGQEEWLDNLYQVTSPRNDLLMLPKDILEYIQGLRYFIGVPEEKSIDLFRQYLDTLDGAGDSNK